MAGLVFSLGLSTVFAQPEESATVTSGHWFRSLVSPSPATLFDLNNMNPSDYVRKILVIKNNYSKSHLYVISNRAEGSSGRGGEEDLSEQLNTAEVTLRGTKIYDGRIDDFATSGCVPRGI